MNAGLSTSPHQYSLPQVREVAAPAQPVADQRRPLTQRELVAMSLSPASAAATSRVGALDQGGVPAADIKKLRQAAGTNCLMCHGK